MSAHHYFRDFSYCDSGMLPWLLVTELMCCEGKKLSELVGERMEKFPCSGEINRKVENSKAVLAAIEEKYGDGKIDKLDGLSIEYDSWRFNVKGFQHGTGNALKCGNTRRQSAFERKNRRNSGRYRRRRSIRSE